MPKRDKSVKANEEFLKMNASNTSSKKIQGVFLQTWMASVFSFKIQLAEMSKRKQV